MQAAEEEELAGTAAEAAAAEASIPDSEMNEEGQDTGTAKRARAQEKYGSDGVPAEPSTPPGLAPRQLSLQDILDSMSNGFAGVGRQMNGMQQQINGVQDVLNKRLAKVEKEQRESQQIAAPRTNHYRDRSQKSHDFGSSHHSH